MINVKQEKRNSIISERVSKKEKDCESFFKLKQEILAYNQKQK